MAGAILPQKFRVRRLHREYRFVDTGSGGIAGCTRGGRASAPCTRDFSPVRRVAGPLLGERHPFGAESHARDARPRAALGRTTSPTRWPQARARGEPLAICGRAPRHGRTAVPVAAAPCSTCAAEPCALVRPRPRRSRSRGRHHLAGRHPRLSRAAARPGTRVRHPPEADRRRSPHPGRRRRRQHPRPRRSPRSPSSPTSRGSKWSRPTGDVVRCQRDENPDAVPARRRRLRVVRCGHRGDAAAGAARQGGTLRRAARHRRPHRRIRRAHRGGPPVRRLPVRDRARQLADFLRTGVLSSYRPVESGAPIPARPAPAVANATGTNC